MQMLIWLGRNVLVAAAALTVVAHVTVGWLYGMAQDRLNFALVPTGRVSVTPVMYAALGLVIGLIVAGAVWGLMAAIFDMQRSLRILCSDTGLEELPRPATRTRGSRIEPRLDTRMRL